MYQKKYCSGIDVVNQVLLKYCYSKNTEQYPALIAAAPATVSSNMHHSDTIV